MSHSVDVVASQALSEFQEQHSFTSGLASGGKQALFRGGQVCVLKKSFDCRQQRLKVDLGSRRRRLRSARLAVLERVMVIGFRQQYYVRTSRIAF